MSENTELITTDDRLPVGVVDEEISNLRSGEVQVYSTIQGNDFASRKKVAAAVASSTPLDEAGKVKLTNYVIMKVQLTNKATGVVEEAPRCILIDDKGKAFHATSFGVLKALRNLTGILGEPSTWDEPVTVEARKEKTSNGFNVTTLSIS